MNKILKQLGTAAIAGSMLISTAAQAGIVTNGGFESGFDGWQQFGSPDANFVAPDPDYVRTGEHAAFFGEVRSLGGITQQLATTTGKAYSLKFWLGNMGASEFNADVVSYFALSLNGAVQTASLLDNKTATGLLAYDVSFLASGDLTELSFAFRQDDAFWFLDDVSVDVIDVAAPIPEPATLPLLFAALAGWLFSGVKRAGSAKGAQ